MLTLIHSSRRTLIVTGLVLTSLATPAALFAADAAPAAPAATAAPRPPGKKPISSTVDDVGMYTLPVSTDTTKKIDESTLTAEQKKLLKRSRERWAALIEFDLEKVYKFATPAYRKTHNQRHLNGQYAAQIGRNRVETQEIKILPDDPNTAKITTLLFVTSRALTGATGMELSSWQHETWVKVDGQWYFVEPK